MRHPNGTPKLIAARVEELIRGNMDPDDAVKQTAREFNYRRTESVSQYASDYIRPSYGLLTAQFRAGLFAPPPNESPPAASESPPAPLSDEEHLRIRELRNDIARWKKSAADYREQLLSQQGLLSGLAAALQGHNFAAVKPPSPIRRISGRIPAEACSLVSDYHAGRVITKLDTEGYNEYNFEIFCARWWRHVKAIAEIADDYSRRYEIQQLWLCFLGDCMTDEHREENIRSNADAMIRMTLKVASVYAQGIRYLIQIFQAVEAHGVVGNEPRLPVKKTAAQKYNNWDWLLYQIINLLLAEEVKAGRLTFHIPFSAGIVSQRLSGNYRLSHGDEVRSWASIPYYGLARRAAREHELHRPSRWRPDGVDFDYWFLGHFHSPSQTGTHGSIRGNGCACGADPFARTDLGLGDVASQKFFLLTEKYGISGDHDIYLQDSEGHPFEITSGRDQPEDVLSEFQAFKPPSL